MSFVKKGNEFFDKGLFKQSLVNYSKALSLDPSSAEAWYGKANATASLKEFEEAIKYYDIALAINNTLGGLWFNKAVTLENLYRYEEALECYDKALEADPNDSEASKNIVSLADYMQEKSKIQSRSDSQITEDSDLNPEFAPGLDDNGQTFPVDSKPVLPVTQQIAESFEDILVVGPPKLTVEHVRDMCSYYEWILDVTLTDQIQEMVKQSMVDGWTSVDPNVIQELERIRNKYREMKKMDKSARDFWRESIQQQTVNYLRSLKGDILITSLLELYDAANAPIAQGEPPLTKEIADAAIEILHFRDAVIYGGSYLSHVSEGVKELWRQYLSSVWPTLPEEEKREIASSPQQWTEICYHLPQMSTQQINNYQVPLTARQSEEEKRQIHDFLINLNNRSGNLPQSVQPTSNNEEEFELENIRKKDAEIENLRTQLERAKAEGDTEKENKLQTLLDRDLQQEQLRNSRMNQVMSIRNSIRSNIISNWRV